MPERTAFEAASDAKAAQARVRSMLAEQPYGVLCTQADSQPYGSLVAFAASADLQHLVFATPKATRKFRLLSRCPNAALVVDTRRQAIGGLMEIEAVTAIGRARLLAPGEDLDRYAAWMLKKHPALKPFVLDESSALFVIDVASYRYVSEFQRVSSFAP